MIKIGRKWATLAPPGQETDDWGYLRCRVDLETLIADGGDYQSPGQCWRTKEEYDLHYKAGRLWDDIRRFFGITYSVPAHLEVDDLEHILNTLKGEDAPCPNSP